MKIKITADSTCDLPQELTEKYDIGIIPLYVVKNGQAYADGIEMCPQDIYDHVAAGGEMCTTAAVSVADYEAFFTEQLKSCDAVVHFHISGDMSCCYQNACIAASELGNVYPVDSRSLSTGIALLAVSAAELAARGDMTAEQIRDEMLVRREKLDVSFTLDTLKYLSKGGRCSAVAALGANALGLKPCIEVRDGKMGVGKKYRGHMDKCLTQYVRERLANRDDIDTERIFVTESGHLTDAELEGVMEEIRKHQSFGEIIHTRAGCTISNHCGPRCLGILYYHK